MLLGLSAFSTSKPQSAFSNQYVLKKTFFNLSRGEIIFEAKGLLKIMGTRKFLFLFFRDTPVFSPDKNKIWPRPWKHNSPEIVRQKAWRWEQLQCWSGTGASVNPFQTSSRYLNTLMYVLQFRSTSLPSSTLTPPTTYSHVTILKNKISTYVLKTNFSPYWFLFKGNHVTYFTLPGQTQCFSIFLVMFWERRKEEADHFNSESHSYQESGL